MIGNFACAFSKNLRLLFLKIIRGIPLECQTDWIKAQTVRSGLGPNYFKRLSADNSYH